MTLNHREVEVQELKKEVNNWSDKFKEQDHDLHTIKTERNLFAKNLTESKVTYHQNTFLNEKLIYY